MSTQAADVDMVDATTTKANTDAGWSSDSGNPNETGKKAKGRSRSRSPSNSDDSESASGPGGGDAATAAATDNNKDASAYESAKSHDDDPASGKAEAEAKAAPSGSDKKKRKKGEKAKSVSKTPNSPKVYPDKRNAKSSQRLGKRHLERARAERLLNCDRLTISNRRAKALTWLSGVAWRQRDLTDAYELDGTELVKELAKSCVILVQSGGTKVVTDDKGNEREILQRCTIRPRDMRYALHGRNIKLYI